MGAEAIRLVVGLGNPGEQYEKTRHNAGFMAVDRWVAACGLVFRQTRYGLLAETGRRAVLKPLTYMNLSGTAVAPFARRRGISPAQIVVVCDDMDLPLGTLRVRASGSSGGHRGLASIIEQLGTDNFVRLKIGVSRPPVGTAVIDWVLGRFSADERKILDSTLDRAVSVLTVLVEQGLDAGMRVAHRPGSG